VGLVLVSRAEADAGNAEPAHDGHAHPAYDFKAFYERVRERGFILYPGKLTRVETFRVGCIGALGGADIEKVVAAVGETLREAGIVLGAG